MGSSWVACADGGVSSSPLTSAKPSLARDEATEDIYVTWTESLTQVSGAFQGHIWLKRYDRASSTWVNEPIDDPLSAVEPPNTTTGKGIFYELPNGSDVQSSTSDVIVTDGEPTVAVLTSASNIIVKRMDRATSQWQNLKSSGGNIRANFDTGSFNTNPISTSLSQAFDPYSKVLYIAYHTFGAVSKLPPSTTDFVKCTTDPNKLALLTIPNVRVRKFDFLNPAAGWQAVGFVSDVCDEKYFYGDRDSDDDQGISNSFGPAGNPSIVLDPFTMTPVVVYSQSTTYPSAAGGSPFAPVKVIVKALVGNYWETIGEVTTGFTGNSSGVPAAKPILTVNAFGDYYVTFINKNPVTTFQYVAGYKLEPLALVEFPAAPPANNVSGEINTGTTQLALPTIAINGFTPAIVWAQQSPTTPGQNPTFTEIFFKLFDFGSSAWEELPAGSATGGGISNTPYISDGDTLDMITDGFGSYWVARKEVAVDTVQGDDEICIERM